MVWRLTYYTPGSLFISDALRKGEFEIGHTGADDSVADVEDFGGGPFSVIGVGGICEILRT
jgi:hypothetical protein